MLLIPGLGKCLGVFLFLGLFLLLAAFRLLLHGGHNVSGNLKRANEIEVKIQPLATLFPPSAPLVNDDFFDKFIEHGCGQF